MSLGDASANRIQCTCNPLCNQSKCQFVLGSLTWSKQYQLCQLIPVMFDTFQNIFDTLHAAKSSTCLHSHTSSNAVEACTMK